MLESIISMYHPDFLLDHLICRKWHTWPSHLIHYLPRSRIGACSTLEWKQVACWQLCHSFFFCVGKEKWVKLRSLLRLLQFYIREHVECSCCILYVEKFWRENIVYMYKLQLIIKWNNSQVKNWWLAFLFQHFPKYTFISCLALPRCGLNMWQSLTRQAAWYL